MWEEWKGVGVGKERIKEGEKKERKTEEGMGRRQKRNSIYLTVTCFNISSKIITNLFLSEDNGGHF